MQFKRWRLVPGQSLVNAGLGLGLFFLATCGRTEETTPPEPTPTEIPAADILSLPAVWSTDELEGRVHDLALAGGGASVLAVAYEDLGLEFFNLDGERIAPVAPLAVRDIAEGTYVDFGDAGLTVFPGVSTEGDLVAYVYGDGLVGPQQVDLPIETDDEALGLCSRRLGSGQGEILQIGYWTVTGWDELQSGILLVEGSEFAWFPTETWPRADDDGACIFADGQPVSAAEGGEIVALERPGATYLVSLWSTGALTANRLGGEGKPLGLRDGITVRAPIPPTAIAALGVPLGGGYPEGVIVVAGVVGYRDRAVFVDAGGLSALAE